MDQVVEWVLRPATGDEPAIVVEPTGTAVAAVTDESETTVISDNGSIHESPSVQTASARGRKPSPRQSNGEQKKKRAARKAE